MSLGYHYMYGAYLESNIFHVRTNRTSCPSRIRIVRIYRSILRCYNISTFFLYFHSSNGITSFLSTYCWIGILSHYLWYSYGTILYIWMRKNEENTFFFFVYPQKMKEKHVWLESIAITSSLSHTLKRTKKNVCLFEEEKKSWWNELPLIHFHFHPKSVYLRSSPQILFFLVNPLESI